MYEFVDKVALVTGASRGIGYAAAHSLAQRGAHVIAVARSQAGLEQLDDAVAPCRGTVTLALADLGEAAAVSDLIKTSRRRFGQLDILLGNAAILGELTPVAQLSGADLERLFTINFFANQCLIAGFEDLLKASAGGRAMFVTSSAARGYAYWGGYGASKAALENLILAWAGEVATSPLRVNLFNPGATRTAMRAKAFPGEDPDTLPACETVAAKLLDCIAAEEHGRIFNYRSP